MMNKLSPKPSSLSLSRRDFLYGLGAGLGSVAFTSLCADEASAPLALKPPHLPGTAKRCIFLIMEGGPSHIDTFDPKPSLEKLHRKEFTVTGEKRSALESGLRYYVQSPFSFARHGQSGAWMSEPWKHLRGVADELCFFRGCQVDSVNHPTAMYQMNCGNRFGGDPALGSWVTYGLGSENQDLPGFIVLPELSYPQGGSANWNNGYLPAHYQGTTLRPKGSPILDLQPPEGVTRDTQRANLDLLEEFNRRHQREYPDYKELAVRMESYELAFRMQMEIPNAIDIDSEPEKLKEEYGIGQTDTDAFGRKCLLARKLVEKGVRFLQLYAGSWDSHDYIKLAHGNLIRQVDKPIATLIRDLKRRGMLDDTLIVWCGEFGRTPDNGIRDGVVYGRDHNPKAMPMWLAGGGVKAGHTIGATDETGKEAVENVHHVRDLHVTLLKLLGLDDNKLTYYHAGRYKQLSQFGGQAIPELIA